MSEAAESSLPLLPSFDGSAKLRRGSKCLPEAVGEVGEAKSPLLSKEAESLDRFEAGTL